MIELTFATSQARFPERPLLCNTPHRSPHRGVNAPERCEQRFATPQPCQSKLRFSDHWFFCAVATPAHGRRLPSECGRRSTLSERNRIGHDDAASLAVVAVVAGSPVLAR